MKRVMLVGRIRAAGLIVNLNLFSLSILRFSILDRSLIMTLKNEMIQRNYYYFAFRIFQ